MLKKDVAMKFVLSRSELTELIRKIQNMTPQTAPIPILSHFLIEAAGDEVVFTATDLTVGAKIATKAKVFQEGGLSVPSRRFFQLIRELTDSTIEVSSDAEAAAEIKAGTSFFRLKGMNQNEYPALPDLSAALKFTMKSVLLKDMLYRTSFAVSRDDSRFAITGLLMQIEEGKVIFAGTDGKRLAKMDASIALSSEFHGDYILPLKAVDEIMKMLEEEGDVTLYLTEDKIAIESETTLLVAKLLAGKYPDYRQLTTLKPKTFVTLHREEMITLLRQVSLFAQENSQSVRFTFVKGELILKANSADVGEGRVSTPVNFEGDQLDIAFNAHFFLDILRHCKDETVTLGLTDAYNPGIVSDSSEALFIIMPMRLNEDI